jgi:hypothetical protein
MLFSLLDERSLAIIPARYPPLADCALIWVKYEFRLATGQADPSPVEANADERRPPDAPPDLQHRLPRARLVKGCRHARDADLAALIAAGRGDVPLVQSGGTQRPGNATVYRQSLARHGSGATTQRRSAGTW